MLVLLKRLKKFQYLINYNIMLLFVEIADVYYHALNSCLIPFRVEHITVILFSASLDYSHGVGWGEETECERGRSCLRGLSLLSLTPAPRGAHPAGFSSLTQTRLLVNGRFLMASKGAAGVSQIDDFSLVYTVL